MKVLLLARAITVLGFAILAGSFVAARDSWQAEWEKTVEGAKKEGAESIVISGKVESELVDLSEEEQKEFLKELKLEETGLHTLIRAGYRLLNLITFFTVVGNKETRAWTVQNGAKAPEAAGKVHSDFEKGFIRAEVVNCEDLIKLGSQATVKEKGLLRTEGKDYIVQDGDVMLFRFSV